MSNSLRVKEAGNRSNKDNLMSNVDSLILNHQQHYHHLKQRAKLRSNNRTTMDTQSQLNNNNSITSNPLLTGQQFNILASQQQQQQTSISASSSPMPLATKATKPNSIGSNQTKLTSMNHTKKSLTADQQQQQQMHVCRLCDKLLSSSSSLDRHMLTHSGERPFVCKRCHMTFTTNGNMHRHMRTHLHKDSLARQQQEQQLKSLVAAGANTVVGASAPATPKSITATATVANTTSTKAPHSIDCRHAGAVFRNSNQIQNNNSLHPHLNNHHQHLANSIFNNQLPCDTASVAAAAAAALCNQQQQAATSVNNSTQSSSAVVSELINQHLVAALKQSPFLYDNQHHNTQHQHHQQLQQSVSNLVSAANPLELHNNSQHLKQPQLGLATIMDQQHLSNKALMIQLAAAAAAAAASSGAGPDHHQQQLGLESVKAVMFAAAAAATAAVNQRQQLQQQQQQRIPEKLTTEQTFDHQASYLNLARGKRRKQIHPRSTKVQQQQSNQTSLVSGDDDDVYSECNERIEVLSRFDANLEDDAGQEKPFSARIVDQKQPNFELAAPEGMKSVHHEHLASSSLSNESATSLDEERKEDLNNNNPVNSGEEVTKIESSSRFVVDGSKLQLVCVNNNQVENDNKLDGPKTIGRSYADMIDSNESGDESEQDEDEDLELDEEELLNVNQMNLITSGEDSLGSDVNMIGSNTSSGSDNNNNSSHSNNNTDSSYDDIDIVGGDDPSRQTLQQRPQEQLAAASGNMDFLDDKQPINYLSAIDDSGNLHETTNIELDDQEIEEEDSKEQQSQLHLTSSEPIKSSKLASKNKSTLINDLDDVIEDISQSYVKTANPNATRKGGKRNRHCYRCKLCTYSSVDRCTLVRHLRIHSGERPYICGICRYAFTTKANCERHVRKRHKKQYNSLGGAGGGGIKGSNGGGRSLIITDHSNHQTIPVKVNPVAAQTISQTLQRIQEKQSIDLAAQALDLSCKRTAAAAAQKVSQKSHKIHS